MRFELMTSPLPRERSTPELRRRSHAGISAAARLASGPDWIRTSVGSRQRIYSPPPLATRAPTRLIRLLSLSHHWDSNPEQLVYKTSALPIELWWRNGAVYHADRAASRFVSRDGQPRHCTTPAWRCQVCGAAGVNTGEALPAIGRALEQADAARRATAGDNFATSPLPTKGKRTRLQHTARPPTMSIRFSRDRYVIVARSRLGQHGPISGASPADARAVHQPSAFQRCCIATGRRRLPSA